MSDTFRVPAGTGESELTEKRSRFLGHLRKCHQLHIPKIQYHFLANQLMKVHFHKLNLILI